jgi:hypothetical protein
VAGITKIFLLTSKATMPFEREETHEHPTITITQVSDASRRQLFLRDVSICAGK